MKGIASDTEFNLTRFVEPVSAFDSDVAQWLLEQLHEKFCEQERYETTLLELYSSVILSNHTQDVKRVAIENLASKLEAGLDVCQSGAPAVELPWEKLDRQLKSEASEHTRNREMANAELRLQGCLLTMKAMSTEQEVSSIEKDIRKWVVKLRFAMQEETVGYLRCFPRYILTKIGIHNQIRRGHVTISFRTHLTTAWTSKCGCRVFRRLPDSV